MFLLINKMYDVPNIVLESEATLVSEMKLVYLSLLALHISRSYFPKMHCIAQRHEFFAFFISHLTPNTNNVKYIVTDSFHSVVDPGSVLVISLL